MTCECVLRLLSVSSESIKEAFNQELLKVIILNTAHKFSTIRKVARGCIANYVRQFKDLKPVLKAFHEHGI